MRRCAAALIALALVGCAGKAPRALPPVPELVKVPVRQYVPVPDALTKRCQVTRPATRQVEAVVDAYNANVAALTLCNGQLDQIRALGAPQQ